MLYSVLVRPDDAGHAGHNNNNHKLQWRQSQANPSGRGRPSLPVSLWEMGRRFCYGWEGQQWSELQISTKVWVRESILTERKRGHLAVDLPDWDFRTHIEGSLVIASSDILAAEKAAHNNYNTIQSKVVSWWRWSIRFVAIVNQAELLLQAVASHGQDETYCWNCGQVVATQGRTNPRSQTYIWFQKTLSQENKVLIPTPDTAYESYVKIRGSCKWLKVSDHECESRERSTISNDTHWNTSDKATWFEFQRFFISKRLKVGSGCRHMKKLCAKDLRYISRQAGML